MMSRKIETESTKEVRAKSGKKMRTENSEEIKTKIEEEDSINTTLTGSGSVRLEADPEEEVSKSLMKVYCFIWNSSLSNLKE